MTEGTRTTVRGRSVDHPLETQSSALLTVRSKPKISHLRPPFARIGEPTPDRSLQPRADGGQES